MAHNREWDKGKEFWAIPDPKMNVRSREDDYQGEGKRRKFNTGAYVHEASQPFEDPGTDKLHDPGHDDRSRGPAGGFKKRLTPSEPSPHVIFLGLDPDFTEADLQAYLSSYGCSIETVTIIRERSTGTSKGFGFAQFTTTEHARGFVDPLFPFIQVPPPASHGASATAAFYKALEAGSSHNGRRVKIDYSQSATPHERGRSNRGNLNDGTRDIGNTQSPLLLFRGLDPLSGPQAIYQAMLYSSGSGKQGPKGMRRIILIKDKVTMASYGFAFVEFVDVQSASAVLAATMSPQLHPNGFRISDKPVAASFAHPYSFQPVTDFIQRDEACLKATNSLGGTEGMWVKYWDESSTCAVLEFKVEEPIATAPTQKEKREKKKKAEVDSRTKQAFVAPSTLPVTDKPVTLSLSKGLAKATSLRPLAPGISMDDDTSTTGMLDEEDNEEESNKSIAMKKVAPPVASKKMVDNIQKWNQVQVELAKESGASNQPTLTPAGKEDTSVPSPESEFEFADVNALMCLLCARQFKSLDQLKRHNKESDLHKTNYKDANSRDVARRKADARKAGVTANQQPPKYRDRASERRILFNQPETPMPEKDGNRTNTKKRQSEGPPPQPSPPPPPIVVGKDENNVGNKLLKLMGWKEGQGLGTDGEGRVDPIQTAIYAQGVGLGASKGKEIGKYTEGYSGYVHMAQDAARERYGNQDRTS
ncbi:hypothetical protein M378DRAFT_189961 [Amanita muscaria Koide BX008]|uniref:RNA-binding protein n=1 Tax=Amanita muscaria (strain Koide BX008) TaxID=946122 RepID=A0A0C2TQK5_AMAMK|nr:hypothetical protein M378DRAFT_189961 [Amanita muscaria Koide BX008]